MRDSWLFCDSALGHQKTKSHKLKMAVTYPFDPSYPKNKGTLFSSILKIGENNVSLVFGLENEKTTVADRPL